MKININILSIPPYISTSWRNIQSLTTDQNKDLVVFLITGERIVIPNLDFETISNIFDTHEKFLEQKNKIIGFKLPISLPEVDGLDSMNSIMQHNQSQSNAPDLPKEVIEKISSIFKIMQIDDQESLPKAEPHCNCFHCQIARAIRGESRENIEEVSEEDLKFRDWEIKKTGKNLYIVTNPLNKDEYYNVFLGKPIGCTCGKKNCEHIKAVLKT
ncbi:MAG: hypothetical protein AMS24_00800 [Chlamydiae bacterium SM23_39]|nr:MAG: hypothetical protein AMS24_00800 [Chlamydiae bacterium SM23_39]